DAAETAQRDKTRIAFHYPFDVLQCFERLFRRALSVALSCHKSTLKYKVMANFSSFKVFWGKYFGGAGGLEHQLHLDITALVGRRGAGGLAETQLVIQIDGGFQGRIAFQVDPPGTQRAGFFYAGLADEITDTQSLRFRRNGHLGQFKTSVVQVD